MVLVLLVFVFLLEFWSSTECKDTHGPDVYDVAFGYYNDGAIVDYSSKNEGYSVRCVKD